MRFAVCILFALTFAGLPLRSAVAQSDPELYRAFDARLLSYDEKRFLQTSLAFQGAYYGLLDGDWGRISQDALEKYSLSEFGESPANWHMAMLAFDFFEQAASDGWQIRYFHGFEMSFLFPETAVRPSGSSGKFLNWNHTQSSLGVSIAIADPRDTESFHEFTAARHQVATELYTVRKDGLAVTFSEERNGDLLYTRSHYIGGLWSTVMLSAKATDKSILQAVSASIASGRSRPITIPQDGYLFHAIESAIAIAEGSQDQVSRKPDTQSSARNSEEKPKQSSGTGFFVSHDGIVLTNAHVVAECASIAVDGNPAIVVDESADFDLAILQTDRKGQQVVAKFASDPAQLNSDVTVAGYPLSGLLGGLNVTRGAVSSLKGLLGDNLNMQISAPVQPGNSGGPIMNSSGEIVGVVVAKLDAKMVAEVTGDIPQNVNFAIRGEIAKLYLFQNGVEPILSREAAQLSPVEIASEAAKFTAYVECKN